MYLRLRSRLAVPFSLAAILLICLSFLGTAGASAAQADQATPIDAGPPVQDDGESPGLGSFSEDGEIGTLSLDSIAFSDNGAGYSGLPNSTINVSVTFSFTGSTGWASYVIRYGTGTASLPDGVTLNTGSISTNDGTNCPAGNYADGISGTIASTTTGSCTISFTLNVGPSAVPSSNGLLTVESSVGDPVDDSAVVTVASQPPTASFSPMSFTGKPGTSVSGSVTFHMLNIGSVDFALEIPSGWSLSDFANTASTGTTTCPVAINGAPFLVSTAPASCTYTFNLGIPSWVVAPSSAFAVIAKGGSPFVQVASAGISVEATAVTGTFLNGPYSAYAGQNSQVQFSVLFDGAAPNGVVTIANPDNSKLAYGNPSFDNGTGVTCENAQIDGAGNLTFDSSSNNAGFCTITFDISVLAGTIAGQVTPDITASRTGTGFTTLPSATFTVPALPTIAFSPASLTGTAGTILPQTSVTFTLPGGGTFAFQEILPSGWTSYTFTYDSATGDATCGYSAGQGNLDGGLAGGTCTFLLNLTIPETAGSGPYTVDFHMQSPFVTPLGTLPVNVSTTTGSASFSDTSYSELAGNVTTISLSFTYDGAFPAGSFTIVNPDPTKLTFSGFQALLHTGGVSCPSAAVDGTTGNLAGSISGTAAGTCSVAFDVTVNTSAPAGLVGQITASGPLLATDPTADFVVDPTPSVTFDQPAYVALPGSSTDVVVQLDFGLEDLLGNYAIVNPDPAKLTFSDVQIVNVGGSNITTAAIDPGTGNVTGFINTAVGGSSTLTITVTVAPGATPGPAGFLEGQLPLGITPPDPSSFLVLDPNLPTGNFDFAPYAAQPGGSTTANFSISFNGENPGGTFTITNPDPLVLAFSDPLAVPSAGASCGMVSITPDGNLTGQAAASGPGSCNITFDITVAGDAIPGLAGNLTATLPGGNAVTPVSFTVLPSTLAIEPISLTLDLNDGNSLSGDLSTQVTGGVLPYTFTLVSGPTQGTLTLNPDGTFTYTANPGANGTDSFTFTVTDSEGVNVTAAATTTGSIAIVIVQAEATATATTEPTVTPTEPANGASPTATERPVIPGRTPTATAISGDGTSGGTSGGNGVTRLPSTGTAAASGGAANALLLLLALGLILLATAAIVTRRRT